MSFRSKVRRDDKYVRLLKIVTSIESKISVNEIIKDMQTMLVARKYKKIDVRIIDNATHELIEWASELNSHRSRLSEIQFIVLDQKLKLEAATKSVHKYLMSQYREDMKAIRGVNERKSYVEDALEAPLELVSKLDRVLKLSDVVLKELEESFKNNTLIKNVFEISTRPDRRV